MQPHNRKGRSKASTEGRVRRVLGFELGWLRGYPAERPEGPVWVHVPPVGRSGPMHAVELTKQRIGEASRAAKRVRRDFPHALPAVVGDVDAWHADVDARLRAARSVASGSQVVEIPEACTVPIDMPSFATTEGAALAEAYRWVAGRERKPLRTALRWAAEHESDLARLARVDFDTSIRLLDIVATDGGQRTMALAKLIWFESASAIALYVDLGAIQHAAAQVGRMARGEEAEFEPTRTVEETLFDDHRKMLETIAHQTQRRRRQLLRALDLFELEDAIAPWGTFWNHIDRTVSRVRKIRHLPTTALPNTKELRKCQTTLARLASAPPPTLGQPPSTLIARLTALEHDATVEKLLAFLALVPASWNGTPARFRLLVRLLEAKYDDELTERALATVADTLARLRRSEPKPGRMLWAWRPTLARLRPLFGCPEDRFDLSPKLLPRYLSYLELLPRVPDVLGGAPREAPPVHRIMGSLLAVLDDADLVLDTLRHYFANSKTGHTEGWVPAEALLVAATIASTGEQIARLLEKFEWLDFCLDQDELRPGDITSFREQIGGARLCELLCTAALGQETRRVQTLVLMAWAGRRSGLRTDLGTSALESSEGPPAAWARPYPAELQPVLSELASLDAAPQSAAARVLGKHFPDPTALRSQIEAIEAQLEADLPRKKAEALERRSMALRRRIDEPSTPSPARMTRLRKDLEHVVALRLLDRAERASHAVFLAKLNLDGSNGIPAHLDKPEGHLLLSGLAGLPRASRRLAVTLLERRADEAPWDLRERGPNRAFLERLPAMGIDAAPWLEGIGTREVRDDTGRPVRIAIEHDPIEVLLMGYHFSTCLSPHGFNFFSAVTNAADVNKRVVYVRDRRGRVLARSLLAITDVGGLLAFHVYAHDHRRGFERIIAEFATELASAMGTHLTTTGRVSSLVADCWYDDGPTDLDGRVKDFDRNTGLGKKLEQVEPGRVEEVVRRAVAPSPLDDALLGRVLHLGVFDTRPELVVGLVPLLDALPDTSIRIWVRAGELALATGETRLARRLLLGVAVPRVMRRARDRDEAYDLDWQVLLDLGHPTQCLRVLKATRPSWCDRWEDERQSRVLVAARAYDALWRPRRALDLYCKAGDALNESDTARKSTLEALLGTGTAVESSA